jgi:hypothetical protein
MEFAVRPLLRLLIVSVVAGAYPVGASAQAYVQAPCTATAPPPFQDDAQAMWYRRFWTGDCKGLPFRCFGGKPNWNEIAHSLISRATPPQREAVTVQACRLGREIGFEWSRPNAVRRIDTGDLQMLNRILEKSADVAVGLANVENRVKAKTGG